MFTTVTKSPEGQNYEQNATDASDNITLLAMAQRWPAETYTSLFARALFQAERVKRAAQQSEHLTLIETRTGLNDLLNRRRRGDNVVGALLGTEGSHALDGSLKTLIAFMRLGFA